MITYGNRGKYISTKQIIKRKVCMNLVLGLSTQFWNFSMQTIDDLSFHFHEGFKLPFLPGKTLVRGHKVYCIDTSAIFGITFPASIETK